MRNPDWNISRRQFLHTMSISAAGLALFSPWQQLFAATPERSLSFFHTHTGEKLKLTYFTDGIYHDDALQEIYHYLRDFRTEEIHPIDPKLLDILFTVQNACDSRGTFEVISGYRSPKTNQKLRDMGRGVAKRSLHMDGKAIDVRLTDVETSYLRKAALSLKRGGVGYYASSDFVHLDTGRVRFW